MQLPCHLLSRPPPYPAQLSVSRVLLTAVRWRRMPRLSELLRPRDPARLPRRPRLLMSLYPPARRVLVPRAWVMR